MRSDIDDVYYAAFDSVLKTVLPPHIYADMTRLVAVQDIPAREKINMYIKQVNGSHTPGDPAVLAYKLICQYFWTVVKHDVRWIEWRNQK